MVSSTIHCQLPNNLKHYIFCIYTKRYTTCDIYKDTLWLTKCAHTLKDTDFKVGRTDTCCKRPECTMCTGMTIAHDYCISRTDKSFFRKYRMTYTILPDIKKIFDIMTFSPFTHDLSLHCTLRIFCRCYMVNHRFYL